MLAGGDEAATMASCNDGNNTLWGDGTCLDGDNDSRFQRESQGPAADHDKISGNYGADDVGNLRVRNKKDLRFSKSRWQLR